ncbi:MAG TPA: MMPL family transporter [Planctomycetaceae bacterium]|nr:MMPL family transporter [Planctomycetaceae bacterium]
MVSFLYRRHGRLLLLFVACSFPLFWIAANSIRCNNDIETWLPRDTDVRQTYEQFKQDFGGEEVIVVGIPATLAEPRLMEAIAGRLERVPGIQACWTPDRLHNQMTALGTDAAEATRRIDGLLTSSTGDLHGVIAVLSEAGTKDRPGVVNAVRDELRYCRLSDADVALTGPPVIVTELDRLGSQQTSRKYFAVTCLLSLGLLYFSFGHWGMSLSTLGLALWGIYVTQAVLSWCGGEMNFIMGSLSVMVMIFTLSISVHIVSYYADARQAGMADPLAYALKECWRPCWLSTLTTLLGLISLNVSSILPVAQFGYAAGLGAVIALIVGLGVTPALLTIWPDCAARSMCFRFDFGRWADWVNQKRYALLSASAVGLVITGIGLLKLKPDVDPVEFLPRNSRVLTDLQRIERELTNVDSIEAIVDFGPTTLPVMDRIRKVRDIQDRIAQHAGVRHTISAASFFPLEMPDSTLETARILSQAQAQGEESGWVTDQQRLWRISARVRRSKECSPIEILADLDRELQGEPITFTGLTPLLKSAQHEIFDGFWKSFAAACLTISIVMILSLRSFLAGLVAMVPNIIPIWLVFGGVGYLGMPVDIGMMMTGSIALGISVDCTFHFLVHYREAYQSGATSAQACRRALEHSGEPMLESTVISSVSMLALCLSSFAPTARFGALMAAQMTASLLGELVLLPALLCCRPQAKPRLAKATQPVGNARPIAVPTSANVIESAA